MMQLIGMLDSPYVRRVAISLKRLGIPFGHRSISVFRQFDEFKALNPMVKAPTLIADDGSVIVDSGVMLDLAEHLAAPRSLMPGDTAQRIRAARLIGAALVGCEKAVQIHYELTQRPAEKAHQPWIDRTCAQAHAAFTILDAAAAQAQPWLIGSEPLQPDITSAVAWSFAQHIRPEYFQAERHPALTAFTARCEALPEFVATPLT
jgi:glutathione S-transferase